MMKLREESEKVPLPRERLVNPECRFASNPYHLCESYCFQTATDQNKRAKHVMKLRSLRKIASFASIPYHESVKSCFGVSAVSKPKGEGKAILIKESWANSKCRFASNPYHKCPEYCSQNASKKERRGQVFLNSMNKDEEILSRDKSMNYDYQLQDTPEWSDEETISAEMRSKEKKIIFLERMNWVNSLLQSESYLSHQFVEYCLQNSPIQMKRHEQVIIKSNEENNAILIEERVVNPNCQFAENLYHAEHCIQNEQKERPEQDFNEEKYHHTMSKCSINFNLVETSKLTDIHAESSFANIMHDCDGEFSKYLQLGGNEAVTKIQEETSIVQLKD